MLSFKYQLAVAALAAFASAQETPEGTVTTGGGQPAGQVGQVGQVGQAGQGQGQQGPVKIDLVKDIPELAKLKPVMLGCSGEFDPAKATQFVNSPEGKLPDPNDANTNAGQAAPKLRIRQAFEKRQSAPVSQPSPTASAAAAPDTNGDGEPDTVVRMELPKDLAQKAGLTGFGNCRINLTQLKKLAPELIASSHSKRALTGGKALPDFDALARSVSEGRQSPEEATQIVSRALALPDQSPNEARDLMVASDKGLEARWHSRDKNESKAMKFFCGHVLWQFLFWLPMHILVLSSVLLLFGTGMSFFTFVAHFALCIYLQHMKKPKVDAPTTTTEQAPAATTTKAKDDDE